MKPSRLALLLSLFSASFIGLAGIARAESEFQLAAGTSAEQFALMGGVFLILGGTFVFAPQIVNAVNGFLAAVLRRPRKTPKPAQAQETQHAQGPVVHVLDAHAPAEQPIEAPPEHHFQEAQHSAWAPPEEQYAEHGHGGGVVSRLREEINLSWSNPHED
jgi:hypothetical protein